MKDIKREAVLSDYVFGKVSPQAIELEEVVIGAMLIDKQCVAEVLEIVSPADFYAPKNIPIVEAIASLSGKFAPVDVLTVADELRRVGKLEEVGGPIALMDMMNMVGSSANTAYHAFVIKEKSVQRAVAELGMRMVRDAHEDAVPLKELLKTAESGIYAISIGGARKQAVQASQLFPEMLRRMEVAKKSPDGLTGVPCGLTTLDRMTGGWQKSDLIGLAARPSMGKTACAIGFMVEAARMGHPVAFFSLEMSAQQVLNRVVSMETGIDGSKLLRGMLEDREWNDMIPAMERIEKLPFFIDDTSAISIHEARSKCTKLATQHGVQLFIFDYIQLMQGEREKGGTRDREVASISAALKSIAKDLDVPVIALSQLSRASEQRGGSKRPMLSDLRDSGAIEQDLDICMFIHRPEYYGIREDEDGNSTHGMAEIIFAKNRNGDVGIRTLRFDAPTTTFSDMEYFHKERAVQKLPTPDNWAVLPPEKNGDENGEKPIPF